MELMARRSCPCRGGQTILSVELLLARRFCPWLLLARRCCPWLLLGGCGGQTILSESAVQTILSLAVMARRWMLSVVVWPGLSVVVVTRLAVVVVATSVQPHGRVF